MLFQVVLKTTLQGSYHYLVKQTETEINYLAQSHTGFGGEEYIVLSAVSSTE